VTRNTQHDQMYSGEKGSKALKHDQSVTDCIVATICMRKYRTYGGSRTENRSTSRLDCFSILVHLDFVRSVAAVAMHLGKQDVAI
jgi:hypothetical protein